MDWFKRNKKRNLNYSLTDSIRASKKIDGALKTAVHDLIFKNPTGQHLSEQCSYTPIPLKLNWKCTPNWLQRGSAILHSCYNSTPPPPSCDLKASKQKTLLFLWPFIVLQDSNTLAFIRRPMRGREQLCYSNASSQLPVVLCDLLNKICGVFFLTDEWWFYKLPMELRLNGDVIPSATCKSCSISRDLKPQDWTRPSPHGAIS